jgi:hypothetical protein
LPEKKRKKLLDPKTWERDGRLVDVATSLRTALGDALFEDHNIFREQVDAALKTGGYQAACCRTEADPEGRELARRDGAAGDRQGPQSRQDDSRPDARPV